jgi:hypothetical protein
MRNFSRGVIILLAVPIISCSRRESPKLPDLNKEAISRKEILKLKKELEDKIKNSQSQNP